MSYLDDLSDREEARLKELTELYAKYKHIMLYADALRGEHFAPPTNEMKDAFDHLMRIYSVKFGLRPDQNENYVFTNIDAAYRHIYRATFEWLDYIRIVQMDYITEKLEDISSETLSAVFPDYYKDIRPEISRIVAEIPAYKSDKDIGSPDITIVTRYFESVKQLRSHLNRIERNIPALIKYEEITKKLEGISSEALVKVFPEYYKEILPDISRIVAEITSYKVDEDVDSPDIQIELQYSESIKQLESHSNRINSMIPALIKYEGERKNEKRHDYTIYAIIAVIAALVGAAASVVISAAIT